MKKVFGSLGLALGMAVLGGLPASAAIQTITDLNTTVQWDAETPQGMFTWSVNGVDQMFQQSFWFRVGSTGPESNISDLTLTGGEMQIAGRVANAFYTGNGFTVEVTYIVTGTPAGSASSDVSEVIRITNTGATTLDFHFFQYSDFDLNGAVGGQDVLITGGNTAQQSGPGGGILMSETVVTPPPSFFEAGLFATTVSSLNDDAPTTLNNVASASGDATWAFQWDLVIGAGQAVTISKDKNLRAAIPEPGALVLLGSATLAVLVTIRKKYQRPTA